MPHRFGRTRLEVGHRTHADSWGWLLCLLMALHYLASPVSAAELEGIIYEAGFGLAGATVKLGGQVATTDSEGRFRITGLDAGDAVLIVLHPRTHEETTHSITLQEKGITGFSYDFAAPHSLDEIVVATRRIRPKPSQQTMLGSEIQRVAGTGGDVLKALQVLPGVTAINDLSGELFIRGGGPQDNVFFFDRTNLFYPYHFGGLVSTISSELIERVDVHAGGFGAEFGNAQAVIDIQSREQPPDRRRWVSNVNFLLSEGFFETPLGEKGSLYLAGRRSYADLIVPHVIDIEQLTAFPRFWDYQGGLNCDLTPNQHLSLDLFGSEDFMELQLGEKDVTDQPELAGKFHYRNGFVGQGLTLRSQLGERATLLNTLSHTRNLVDLAFGQGFFLRAIPDSYALRQDLDLRLTDRHTLQSGSALQTVRFRISAFFVRPPEEGQPTFDFSSEEKIRSESVDRLNYLGLYLQDQVDLAWGLALTLGGRLSYFNLTGEWRIEPRVRLNWQVPGGARLTAAWGEYGQTPEPVEVSKDWGNPTVESSRARHYVLEIEREILRDTSLKVAAYYKDFTDLITADPKATYLNQGTGFARGLEMLLKYHPSDNFFTWLSYTYSLSRRRDAPAETERLYSYDQTHVATLTTSYRPSRKWEIGLRWHYATGTPYTPVINAQPVFRAGGEIDYIPIYGDVNSGRLPPFHRLDLRIARTFQIGGTHLEAYLEVLNAYYRRNVLAIDYNDDYTEEETLHQLPIVPYLGISWKF